MWNSLVSKMRGLLGGLGSLLALWSSLKSPVPMFMGIPMMMHSDTPETNQKGGERASPHLGKSSGRTEADSESQPQRVELGLLALLIYRCGRHSLELLGGLGEFLHLAGGTAHSQPCCWLSGLCASATGILWAPPLSTTLKQQRYTR